MGLLRPCGARTDDVFLMTKQRAFFLTLILVALVGIFLTLYATPEGLGLSDDSIAYIAGARSILSGQGYREAWLATNGYVTHYPPVFSSTLAFIGLSGMDPLRAARFLNAFLFGANAFLLGLIGWRMAKLQIAGMVSALLFAANASLFRVHVTAMSEPLYIFFSLAAFLTFASYFGVKQLAVPSGGTHRAGELPNSKWLIATGILTSFAYLTRYAGLALLVTFLFALILLHDNWKQRLSRAGIFLAGFLPLTLAWSIRNKFIADAATNRTFVYHPLTQENINSSIYNLSEFLIPVETWRRALIKDINYFFVFASVIAFILFVWTACKGLKKFLWPSSETPEILSLTNGLYIFGYLASIISSMLFFDASTKFKLRILAPIYVALLILFVFFGHWLWQKRAMFWRGLVIIIFPVVFFLSACQTYNAARELHAGGGQGYASFKWYDSKAMDFLSKLPEGTRIYTNQAPAVYLYTNRPAYVLPDLVDPVTGLPRGNFEYGVNKLHEDVLSGSAALALFEYGAEAEEVRKVYDHLSEGLYLALQAQGDRIYTAP